MPSHSPCVWEDDPALGRIWYTSLQYGKASMVGVPNGNECCSEQTGSDSRDGQICRLVRSTRRDLDESAKLLAATLFLKTGPLLTMHRTKKPEDKPTAMVNHPQLRGSALWHNALVNDALIPHGYSLDIFDKHLSRFLRAKIVSERKVSRGITSSRGGGLSGVFPLTNTPVVKEKTVGRKRRVNTPAEINVGFGAGVNWARCFGRDRRPAGAGGWGGGEGRKDCITHADSIPNGLRMNHWRYTIVVFVVKQKVFNLSGTRSSSTDFYISSYSWHARDSGISYWWNIVTRPPSKLQKESGSKSRERPELGTEAKLRLNLRTRLGSEKVMKSELKSRARPASE
ncbi:hypothetical protein EVAR_38334_1 [Eumeta japonica]|uniref:Uncharacterized protein n=1 Tax=Eumeta variegata TaxID=151549 RepID=A0A4C1X539_EUMVA|nr:hypothetical protein EVAR_38334_1 [Eumeta japonica]